MDDDPQVGDRVHVKHTGKRPEFSGVLVKVTRRRLDKTCERPVTYWHIRTDAGRVERWVNVWVAKESE